MDAPELPLEILLHIATISADTFKAMLAIPSIARLSIGDSRRYILSKIVSVTKTTHCTRYMLGKYIHRYDGPAVITGDGTTYWYNMGKLEREGGPAIEMLSGAKYWCKGGLLHNETGPAIITEMGSRFWYREGKRHRDGDLPAIEYTTGMLEWFVDDKKHRVGGPAVIGHNGKKEWHYKGVYLYTVFD